jgi:hypothetical protein
MTTTPTAVRVVARTVAGIDIVLLLVAGAITLHTWTEMAQPGDHGFTSLGYLFAGLFAVVALPSLAFAAVANWARGTIAVACAILSVLVLVAVAVFAMNYL